MSAPTDTELQLLEFLTEGQGPPAVQRALRNLLDAYYAQENTIRDYDGHLELAKMRLQDLEAERAGGPITDRRGRVITIIPAPGGICAGSGKLNDGTKCPGCRACS